MKLSSLAGASLLVPELLKGISKNEKSEDRKLIIIQLSGGNDGLNTIIPFSNDIYYRNRPSIAISRNKTLPLNDETGLHPSLSGLRKLYDRGEVSIINNVGYAHPYRSHFKSLNFWHTASARQKTGWLGRYLDLAPERKELVCEMSETKSLAIKGNYREGIAWQTTNSSVLFSAYPDTLIGNKLKQVAQLINSELCPKVFYLSHEGFDTHISQIPTHEKLLSQLDEALHSFTKELRATDKFKDVVVVIFSEFGRRVAENEHKGTDHGAASNMFLLSGGLKKAGLYNPLSNLEDLDEGDVKYEIDFRQVYATLLEKWLGANAGSILGNEFNQLNFI
ncbi:MAG TPA: DUF1501 domain-containing protein [Flavipsychrobacter sp.]|nr:DUF1501 domain-containing protein [Flavipsychrobacter sp.]